MGQMIQQDAFAQAAVAYRELIEAEYIQNLAREQGAGHDDIRPGRLEADDLTASAQRKGTEAVKKLLDPLSGQAVAHDGDSEVGCSWLREKITAPR